MLQPSLSITITLFFLFLICEFICMVAVSIFWKPKLSNKWVTCLLSAIVLSAASLASLFLENEPLSYLLYAGAVFLVLLFSFNISVPESILISLFSVFHTMCLKGIIAGLFSSIALKNIYQILSINKYIFYITVISAILKLLILFSYKLKTNTTKYKVFFSCDEERNTVIYLHIVLFLFMLFQSYNYYYNLDVAWFTFSQVLIPILMLVIYTLILNYGIRVADLLNREMRQKRLNEQMENRLARHQAYVSNFEQINTFKHNYREFMLSAQYYCEQEDYSKLGKMILSDMPVFLELLPSTKKFANEPGCDAMLYEWSTLCISKDIQFNAMVYVPNALFEKKTALHQLLQLLRELHGDLLNGCANNGKSVMLVESNVENSWFTIRTSSSYRGTIDLRDNLPYFLTSNALDIKSKYRFLHTIVESQNGIISCYSVPNTKMFTISISFYCNDTKQE